LLSPSLTLTLSLKAHAKAEQFSQAVVGIFPETMLVSSEASSYEVHFETTSLEELHNVTIPFSITSEKTCIVHG
jgi:hypothetical protein